MAKKSFEIQGSKLRLGGVDLEAGTTGVVIPGVTQAINYFVEEINDIEDDSNPDIFGNNPEAVKVIDNAGYLYRSNDETPSGSYSAAGYSVQELDDGEIKDIYVEVSGTFLDSDRTLALAGNMWATTVSDPYTNFNPNDWTQIPYRPKLRAGEVENIGGGTGGSSVITIPAESGTTYKGLQVAYGSFHSNGEIATKSVTKVVIHKPAVSSISITDDSNSDFFQVSGLADSDVLAMFVLVSDINGQKSESDIQAFAEAVIDNIILYNGEEGEYNTVNNMKDAFYTNTALLATAAGGTNSSFQFYVDAVPTLNGGVTQVQQGNGAEFDIVITNEGVYAAGIISTVTVNQRIENDGGNSIHTTTSGAENIPIGSTMTYDGRTYTVTNILIPDPAHGSGIEIQVSPNIFLFPSADTYTFQTFLGPNSGGGSGYKNGHKVKILGTSLGGVTPDNDAIVEVYTTNGAVTNFNITGTPANNGSVWAGYSRRTGTNYNVGSSFAITDVNRYFSTVSPSNYGYNYVMGDVITLLGENVTGGTTPENNITITVGGVGVNGEAYNFNVSGVVPDVWPASSINDGGNDEYDTGNFINSSYDTEIGYNGGNTVSDGSSAFGDGSTYSFVYENGIFGLFVRGNSSSRIGTSGSGPDSGSIIESGHIYGPDTAQKTYDNAVTHLNVVSNPYTGPLVSFVHTDNGNEVDILIADDGDGAGVGITRDSANGIYNPYREEGWNSNVSPDGTLWNVDGWSDLADVETRNYTPLYEAFGFGGLGAKIVGTECIMYLPDNGKYYTVKFNNWTQGGGGGFAYTRRELNLDKLQEGIRFLDGTVLKSAEGIGRVKLTAPVNRRIEEVYGYKQVSVTSVNTLYLNATASRNATNENRIWIDSSNTTIDDILNNYSAAGIIDPTTIQFSLDDINWYTYNGSTSFDGNERGYGLNIPVQNLSYNAGAPIYFKYNTGGAPVVWWDKSDLPGGSANFRGAVIDYHAFTGESTIIGTIHIVDDDGEDHISHIEVQSGSTDGENDDLWYVTQEGQIQYRRIDGESKTLKIQWGAKVFYGSEIWD